MIDLVQSCDYQISDHHQYSFIFQEQMDRVAINDLSVMYVLLSLLAASIKHGEYVTL